MGHYLLTGAAGFIASQVAELLLEQGHTMVAVDNLNDAYDRRLKYWRLQQLQNKSGFEFHEVSISSRDDIEHIFEISDSFDAVINLAARAGVRQSVADPWVYYDTNTVGTLNLLELCRAHDIKKFILASTSSLYGQHNTMPYSEDADTNRPLSPYAASKKAAETLCYTYHHLYGIDVTVFRYFTVYGPAGRPDMSIFRFIQWIKEGKPVTVFGDGNQSRDFTYVQDIARGTVAGLKPLGYEIINLGSDTPVLLIDILHLIEQELGEKAEIVFQPRHIADVMATWADVSKAEELLGWKPQMDYREGLRRSIEWYMQQRDWAKDIVTGV